MNIQGNNSPEVVNTKLRDRRIDSEEKLIKYIRTMLGEPMITVDVSDDQIALIIDETIRKFSDFAFDGERTISFIIEGEPGVRDYILDYKVRAVKSISFANSLGSVNQTGAGGINLGPGWGTIGINYVPYITMQGEISSLEPTGRESFINGGVAGGVGEGSMMENMANAFVTLSQRDALQSLFGVGVNFEFNSNSKILRIFEEVTGPFLVEASIEYIPNPEYDEIYNHPWIKNYALNRVKFLWGTITGKYSQPLVGGAEINYADMKSEAETALQQLEEDLLNKYSEPLGIFSG